MISLFFQLISILENLGAFIVVLYDPNEGGETGFHSMHRPEKLFPGIGLPM
jgi:hypothetical protein